MTLFKLFAFVCLLALPAIAYSQISGQTIPPTTNIREFQTISTSKLDTFEKELSEFANQGFRLERLLETFTILHQAAILSRQPTSEAAPKYEYKLLITRRVSTLQKELEEAANEGYEVRGIMSSGKPYVGSELVLVLERPASVKSRKFQYRVLSVNSGKEKKLQESIQKAVTEGFSPVKILRHIDVGFSAMVGIGGPKLLVVMARLDGNQIASLEEREFKVLEAVRITTMEKELNQAAKDGYHFILSSAHGAILLARERKSSLSRYEYKLLEMKKRTEESVLEIHSEQGFAYRATYMGLGGMAAVLERNLQADVRNARQEYKIISFPDKENEKERFTKEITDALTAGFRFLDITSTERLNVIMIR